MPNGDSVEAQVVRLLTERTLTLAVAESCTGGLIGHRLTNVPGSSACFLGGVVAYHDRAKADILGADEDVLSREGAVSEAVAVAMARGVCRLLDADLAVGVTGIAGPSGGTPEKPVGTVFIALADRSGETVARQCRWEGDREENKERSAQAALELVRAYVMKHPQ
jgi:nicotinamide-nucleotide amidase